MSIGPRLGTPQPVWIFNRSYRVGVPNICFFFDVSHNFFHPTFGEGTFVESMSISLKIQLLKTMLDWSVTVFPNCQKLEKKCWRTVVRKWGVIWSNQYKIAFYDCLWWMGWMGHVPSMVSDSRACCSVLSRSSLLIRVSLVSIREWRLSYSVHMYSIRDTFIRIIVSILTSWWDRLVYQQFVCSLYTFFPLLYSNLTTSPLPKKNFSWCLPLPQKTFCIFFYLDGSVKKWPIEMEI